MINSFYTYLSDVTGINKTYIYLVLSTTLVIMLFIGIKRLVEYIIKKRVTLSRQYNVNQVAQYIVGISEIIILFFVWDDYFKSLITLISVIGATTMIVLKEAVLSLVAGIYIRVKRIFVVGDRIEINGIRGDVMNIGTVDFDILQIDNETENGQSTGIIVTLPNNYIITKELKNITKGFKYVWDELTVKIDLDSDLSKSKKEIYKIVNSLDSVKSIINKMKDERNVLGTYNKVYFNKYDPIIYTKIVDDHIELTIRYLMDPKKSRNVESVIWNKIYEKYKDKTIKLYKG